MALNVEKTDVVVKKRARADEDLLYEETLKTIFGRPQTNNDSEWQMHLFIV